MRLTLRNLLRFLDQSELRSMERARLEQLVDESEKADGLIKRIDSLRKNSATAVPSIGQGDVDLNEVTSYLDGTMSEETISEFEKSLLGSDIRLAEVSSCHEIRESISASSSPAVSLLLRQSIYDLGREVNYDLATRANEAKQADIAVRSEKDQNEDEDVDATSEREVAQIVATMEDLPYVDASPDQPEPIGGLSPEPEEEDGDDNEVVSLNQLKDKASRQSSARLLTLFAGALALIGVTFALGWYAGQLPQKLAANSSLPKSPDGEVKDRDTDESPAGQNDEKSADPDTSKSEGSDKKTEGSDLKTPDPDPALVAEMHPLPGVPELEVPVDPNALAQAPSLFAFSMGEVVGGNPKEPEQPVGLLEIATASPTGRVPFVLNAEGLWQAAEAAGKLAEDTRIHVLAGDRVELDFSGNVKATIIGPALAQIGRRDVASKADVLVVDYGEVTVVSQVTDIDFWLQRNKRQYRITFPEKASTLEARFTRYREPGSDPRTEPMAEIDRLDVTVGRALVTQMQNEFDLTVGKGIAQSVSVNESLTRPYVQGSLSATPPVQRFRTKLTGILEDNPDALLLGADENLTTHLAEMKGERRQEFRFGSIVWMASLGNYDFLIDYLNESSNRGNWRSLLQAIRRTLETNPDNAARLYQALSVVGAEDQQAMYDAILGVKPEALETGGDEQMVEWLRSNAMSVRVLAIESIRSITGKADLGYKAHSELKVRRRIVERQWGKVLKKKELRYPQPPTMPFPKIEEPDPVTSPDAKAESPDSSTVPSDPDDSDS